MRAEQEWKAGLDAPRDEFHMALAQQSKNPVLQLFIDVLMRLTARYACKSRADSGRHIEDGGLPEHRLVFDNPTLLVEQRVVGAVLIGADLAADAKQRIANAVTGLAAQGNGLSANLTINDLRLTGIAYDDKTLRVITNATGQVNVAVSSLAMQ